MSKWETRVPVTTKVGSSNDRWGMKENPTYQRFTLYKRIPYLFSGKELPKGPDADSLNARSASKARKREKAAVIDEFISVRKDLIRAIGQIPDEAWEDEWIIGQAKMNLYDYLDGLIRHDVHHFKQIQGIIG